MRAMIIGSLWGLLLGAIFSVVTKPVFGADLGFYREQFGVVNERGRNEKQAHDRAMRLRELLGTDHLRFVVPAVAGNANTHELTSSAFFKQVLAKGALALHRDEAYGKPATFDPSDFNYEIDQKVRRHMLDVCRSTLGGALAQLTEEFAAMRARNKASDAAEAANDAKTALLSGAAIEAYILRNEPRAPGQPLIADILGHMYQVQAIDGVVTKIRFTRRGDVKLGATDVLGDADATSVTLSMLAGFRADRDRYFLDIQDCFVDYLESQAAAAAKDKKELDDTWVEKHTAAGKEKMAKLDERIAMLAQVKSEAVAKYDGAKAAAQLLGRLSRAQVNFLLDLMIQLRGNDIPVEDEMRTYAMYSSVAAKSDVNKDFVFYHALHEDLYQLSDALSEEKKNEENQKTVLEGIRSGK
jgi:hypothetical protein